MSVASVCRFLEITCPRCCELEEGGRKINTLSEL